MRPRRRGLPEFWKEIPVARRVSCLEAMLTTPGVAGQLEAIRRATKIRPSDWRRIKVTDRMALLDQAGWTDLQPAAKPIFESYPHEGIEFIFPAENFTNGTCLEYPLADEYLRAFLDQGNEDDLRKLTAVLLREKDHDQAAALKRDDDRVPLSSRAEVEERATRLHKMPRGVLFAVLLYFTGVKTMVHQLYGSWLFETPDEEDEAPAGDPLGWWGMYIDAAKGDVTKLEKIQHSNFHNFCLMEVRRRKQIKDAEMRQRIQTNP